MPRQDVADLPPYTPPSDVEAYYIPRHQPQASSLLYDPTMHVQGAWKDDEQHLSLTAGLLVHAIEKHEPRDDMQLGRVTFDVLGVIPLRPTEITVTTIRPGRTIELVEAEAKIDGRLIIVARAWRLSRHDSSPISGVEAEPMPPVEECVPEPMSNLWPGGFISSLERFAEPGYRPGRARVWLRSHMPLVLGEEVAPTATFSMLIDGANGVAVRADPREWMFPNVDLTIHFFKEPDATLTGFDTTVAMGETGLGTTMTLLHDIHGPVGRATQCLTVRKMPS